MADERKSYPFVCVSNFPASGPKPGPINIPITMNVESTPLGIVYLFIYLLVYLFIGGVNKWISKLIMHKS